MKIGMWTLLAPFVALPAWTLAAPAMPLAGLEGHGKLVRIDGEDEVGEAFDAERWREALVVKDLDQRERNFDALVELARHDLDARAVLDEWAAGDDADLAWTARLARRELGPAAGLSRAGSPFANRGVEMRFGDLHDRLRELESMFDDLGRGYGLWVEQDPLAFAPPSGPGVRSESKSYSIELGPGKARVKVTEDVDGEQSVREYEGETLDELFEANPELRDRIQVRTGGADLWRDPFANLRQRGLLRPDAMLPRTDKLGIEYERPSAALASRLDLEAGVGLVVLRTLPGTIANILAIKRGDVLIELNQNKLYSGDDVERVLRERQPGADVEVVLVDARGQRRAVTWHPREEGGLDRPFADDAEPR